jgi:hypothetical protein
MLVWVEAAPGAARAAPGGEGAPMGIVTWLKRLFGLGRVRPSVVTAAELLVAVQRLQESNAQWPAIWEEINPDDDPVVRALLVELRNRGLQFTPHIGLNRIELACRRLMPDQRTDRVALLKSVLEAPDLPKD